MPSPNIKQLSEFRQRSSSILKEIAESSTPLFLTQNGEAAAVVVSPAMWEKMQKSITMMRLLTILDGQASETDRPFEEVMDEIENMVEAYGQ